MKKRVDALSFWGLWSIPAAAGLGYLLSDACPFAGCNGLLIILGVLPQLLIGGSVWLIAGFFLYAIVNMRIGAKRTDDAGEN